MRKSIAIIFCLFVLISSSKATHVIGADLTFRCLGSGQYEVTYTFYRDCFGIPAPLTAHVELSNNCGFPVFHDTIPLISSSKLISPHCMSSNTTCEGGPLPGFMKYIYRGVINIPAECEQWTISHVDYNRSAGISSLNDPDIVGLFISASFNNTNGICNSSPVFENDPVILACHYQPFCIDPGIFEANGDSIVCSLIAPRTGHNETVTYLPGYSVTNPLSISQPVNFNSNSGALCMIPTHAEIGVIAVLVSQFRNGILIGQVERDVEIRVQPCVNESPVLFGINGSTEFNIVACPDSNICFSFFSDDADSADTTVITWDHGIPGATITTTGGLKDNAMFCWTPTTSEILTSPHCFNATVTDNNCQYPVSVIYRYCVSVVEFNSCMTLSTDVYFPENGFLKIFPQPSSGIFNVDFIDNLHPSADYLIAVDNLLGQRIYQTTFNNKKMQLNLSHASGLLIVSVSEKNGKVLKRGKILISK